VAAYIIDIALIGFVSYLVGGPEVERDVLGNIQYGANRGTILAAVYFVPAWGLAGTTIGMRIVGLRIIRENGRQPDLAAAAIRFVVMVFSFVLLAIGVLWVAFDAKKQGWHDKAAGTVVVHGRA
jgi:uncharacterized RDD family membrane protein YckC